MIDKIKHAAAVLICAITVASTAVAQGVSGPANVIDGDTISVRGVTPRIRLYGINTPEGRQICDNAEGKRYLCGSHSADALASLIGRNGHVTCEEMDRDRYERIVAVFKRGDVDLNGALVKAGWANEYTGYSDGRYASAEVEARRMKRGLWSGEFVTPWDWRKGIRLPSEHALPTRLP